jgi:hypothetical protein
MCIRTYLWHKDKQTLLFATILILKKIWIISTVKHVLHCLVPIYKYFITLYDQLQYFYIQRYETIFSYHLQKGKHEEGSAQNT